MLSYLDLTTTASSFNLALEQYVFDSLPKDRNYFMLWQNDKAVMEAYGMSVRETTEATCVAELMRRYQELTK